MASRAGYFLAPIPVIVGLAVAGWLVWSAIAELGNAFIRFVVPGSIVLSLAEPGSYTIFHEPESMVDGRLYAAPDIPGLRVNVTGEDGTAIPLAAPAVSSSYTIGSHSGKSMLAFEIARPGRYRLIAEYDAGAPGPQTVLTVSPGIFGRLVRTILGAAGAVLVGFLATLALVLTTYFRRRRIERMKEARSV